MRTQGSHQQAGPEGRPDTAAVAEAAASTAFLDPTRPPGPRSDSNKRGALGSTQREYPLDVTLITTEQEFDALEAEYDRLLEESPNATIFSAFAFVRTAWKHFNDTAHRLFILTLRSQGQLVGVVPLRIDAVCIGRLVLVRTLRFIGEWGFGDKPTALFTIDEGTAWEQILCFLDAHRRHWDAISLAEQSPEFAALIKRLCANRSFRVFCAPAAETFHANLDGGWEMYTQAITTKALRELRRRKRKLEVDKGEVTIRFIDTREAVDNAIDRYVRIEQSGWKRGPLPHTVGGNTKNLDFYRDLVAQLVKRKMASVVFLTAGDNDTAGAIIYRCKETLYSAQWAYEQEYSRYSPGALLVTELVRANTGRGLKKLDFLGLQDAGSSESFKKTWGTGSAKTVTVAVYKSTYRLMLHRLLARAGKYKRLARRWRKRNGG